MNEFFFDTLDRLQVSVEYADLSNRDRLGEYVHAKRLVRLHKDLGPREHPFVLGHETRHAILGEEPTMLPHINARMEREADEWSALHNINIWDYREAEREHNAHVPTMAFHLGVVEEAVEVFRGMLARLGDAVYLRPRMGVGNWDRKLEVA